MLPALPTADSGFILSFNHGETIFKSVFRRWIFTGAIGGEQQKKERSKSRAQSTHTAHQQRKYVEQASASSGNQCVLGHRSVPRFELFAPDDSTNGGRAMFGVLARLASATIPVFEQEKQYAIRS